MFGYDWSDIIGVLNVIVMIICFAFLGGLLDLEERGWLAIFPLLIAVFIPLVITYVLSKNKKAEEFLSIHASYTLGMFLTIIFIYIFHGWEIF